MNGFQIFGGFTDRMVLIENPVDLNWHNMGSWNGEPVSFSFRRPSLKSANAFLGLVFVVRNWCGKWRTSPLISPLSPHDVLLSTWCHQSTITRFKKAAFKAKSFFRDNCSGQMFKCCLIYINTVQLPAEWVETQGRARTHTHTHRHAFTHRYQL